jgi:hypothetical protein
MARDATDPQPRNRAARGLVAAIVRAPLIVSRGCGQVGRRTPDRPGSTPSIAPSAGLRWRRSSVTAVGERC